MAGYIESLPPETRIGSVFSDIHRQVAWMVDTVQEINNGRLGHLIGVGDHPAKAMAVTEHHLPSRHLGPFHIGVRRKELAVELGDTQHRLLGVTSSSDYSRTWVLPEDRISPVNVMAYRGEEHPQGDYSIRETGFQEHIAVELGTKGLDDDETSKEPDGVTSERPFKPIGELSDDAKERLTIVSHEIFKRISVARLIMLGGDPRDTLVVLGRDVNFVDQNPIGLLCDSQTATSKV